MAPLLRIAARLRLRLASIALVPAMSDDERATVDIDDGPGRKADGHKREDLLRDILTQADTADGQGSRGLGKHVAARATRHAPQNLLSMVARTSSMETVLNGPVRN